MTDKTTAAKAMIERMRAKHPAAFPIPIRPLKVGIREDLITAGWPMEEVKLALGYYVNIMPYIAATCEQGAFRIDLNGCPTSPVQQHEAEWVRDLAAGRAGYLSASVAEQCGGEAQSSKRTA